MQTAKQALRKGSLGQESSCPNAHSIKVPFMIGGGAADRTVTDRCSSVFILHTVTRLTGTTSDAFNTAEFLSTVLSDVQFGQLM